MYLPNEITIEFIFYVYAYLRKDGTPYYIGKGKGRRVYEKHQVSIPRNKSQIVFLETNLSEIGALALERRYIAWYGRKDNRTGILRNMTDGGEGASNPSADTRYKIGNARRDIVLSGETKLKISKSSKNKHNVSEDTRNKLKEARKSPRPNLTKSNADANLIKIRAESLRRISLLRNSNAYGFESIEKCYIYFSALAATFSNLTPRVFTIRINDQFARDFPSIVITGCPIRELLKYLNIEYPKIASCKSKISKGYEKSPNR